MSTTVARLICDEPTARRLAFTLGDIFGVDDTVCATFADDAGRWQMAMHFRTPPDEAALRAQIAIAAGEKAAAALSIERVASADWVKQSLAGLRPVRAGRFVVHGAHDRDCVKPNDIGLQIEAALAFGTGHHGTTRGCLLALDALAKRRKSSCRLPADNGLKRTRRLRVLDIGTGSGVLAIAAAKTLNAHVTASDIDPVAVEAARANARLNRTPGITFVCAAGPKARVIARTAPYDFVFANILLGPLTRLAVPLRRLAASGAHVVLSGLLPGHVNAIVAIYRAQGFALERRILLEGWATLVLRRGRLAGHRLCISVTA
jgi:ribosomal protein L11 methyltransferase